MEENVNKMLGVEEPKETTNNLGTSATEVIKKEDNSAESTLAFIANTILVLGIIGTLVCLFTLCWIKDPTRHYSSKMIFNPDGFATTVMVLFSTLISWSVMRVLANISNTLKDIKAKLK